MNAHEQRMCEMQAEFFELSTEIFSCSSYLFISRFMNNDIAKSLDRIDDPYNFVVPNSLISSMSVKYQSLNKGIGEKIQKRVMKWIGYVYRAWSIIKKKESSMIYKNMKAQKMVALYDAFHTFSIEYCVDRLEEIVNQDNEPTLSDYEVFKRIYNSDTKR